MLHSLYAPWIPSSGYREFPLVTSSHNALCALNFVQVVGVGRRSSGRGVASVFASRLDEILFDVHDNQKQQNEEPASRMHAIFQDLMRWSPVCARMQLIESVTALFAWHRFLLHVSTIQARRISPFGEASTRSDLPGARRVIRRTPDACQTACPQVTTLPGRHNSSERARCAYPVRRCVHSSLMLSVRPVLRYELLPKGCRTQNFAVDAAPISPFTDMLNM